MPILVDGNNLLGFSNLTEEQLTNALSRLSDSKGLRVLLCFDGARSHGRSREWLGKFQVLFSGHYQTADDVILAEIAKLKDKHGWVLYSNDRKLSTEARFYGIKIESAQKLLAQLKEQRTSESMVPEKPGYERNSDDLLQAMLKGKK